MRSGFNQYEQQLDDIAHADWNTHYLSNEARVKERSTFLQYTIGGVKIGSLLGRICKLLHLNCFECVQKFFSCCDLDSASQIIKDTIRLINDKTCPPPSTLSIDEKHALFRRASFVFNALIDSVNTKRSAFEKLPDSVRINLPELLGEATPPISAPIPLPQKIEAIAEPKTELLSTPPVTSAANTTSDANRADISKVKKKRQNRKTHAEPIATTRKSSRLAALHKKA